jgi:hypothetical protein
MNHGHGQGQCHRHGQGQCHRHGHTHTHVQEVGVDECFNYETRA